MSNEVDIFQRSANMLAASASYDEAVKETQAAGGGGEYKRITIRGKVFRAMHGQEEVHRFKPTKDNPDGVLEVVIVGASKVLRTYYEGEYDPKATKQPRPTCGSNDGLKPDATVPKANRCAATCASCEMNVKGSARNGKGRACSFRMELALCLAGDYENVYTLSVPAMSLFGDKEGKYYPLQAYFKYLGAHKMPFQAVITEVSFDDDSETPKLFFRAVDNVDADVFESMFAMSKDPEIQQKLVQDFTPPKEDDSDAEPEAAAEPKRKRQAAPVEDVADDEDEADDEPKKRRGRKAAAETDDWDDELDDL